MVRKTRDGQVQEQLKRGRDNTVFSGNTFIIGILTILIMITIRIVTYSFNICVLSFYNVTGTVLSVSDRTVNRISKSDSKDAGRQGREVNV